MTAHGRAAACTPARTHGRSASSSSGLPNSGKSQLFNSLTGAYELVSNYPLTTVEVQDAATASWRARCWEVADTPGLHGLYIQSEEELVVRARLFSEPPDVLVQCVDANRFKESLLLTADLLGLGIPSSWCSPPWGERARRAPAGRRGARAAAGGARRVIARARAGHRGAQARPAGTRSRPAAAGLRRGARGRRSRA